MANEVCSYIDANKLIHEHTDIMMYKTLLNAEIKQFTEEISHVWPNENNNYSQGPMFHGPNVGVIHPDTETYERVVKDMYV